jgi:predicted ATPase/DNA-binding winged helix-turn-helix (wHTH) protein
MFSGGEASALAFGPFCLLPNDRLLMRAGQPVGLHGRAMDVLLALADRAGDVVSKRDLLAQVWPDTAVEEINLRVQVAAIRRVLDGARAGTRYIATIPGQGYRFVAPVARVPIRRPAQRDEQPLRSHNLPTSLVRMIGRASILATLVDRVQSVRLVTIVGPGGIGKTTLALALARQLLPHFAQGVRFVDLASLTDGGLLPTALAAALDIIVDTDKAIVAVAKHLRDRRMLLLLDNCEHVAAHVAALVEELLAEAPNLQVLATSREPLRVSGELVQRLPALATPQRSQRLTAVEALAYPAVELFVERATGSLDGELDDKDAAVVAQLCWRLDGIPLAIELAAANVNALGLLGLAAQLEDRFGLLMKGTRTAMPRQRTLRATLDWSYGTLSAEEQVTLRRLAVFRGGFTLESAAAVAATGGLSVAQVMDAVVKLVDRSLIASEVTPRGASYRLLEMTRAYLTEKLLEIGEEHNVRRRHAQHMRAMVEHAQRQSEEVSRAAWLETFAGRVDDVRAALDWSSGPAGDPVLNWSITAACVPFAALLSLRDEFRQRALRALDAMAVADAVDPALCLRVHVALVLFSPHVEAHRCLPAIRRSLALAESLDARPEMAVSLEALAVAELSQGDYHEAQRVAIRHRRAAKQLTSKAALLNSDRLMAIVAHHLGHQRRARDLARRVQEHADSDGDGYGAWRMPPRITIRIWQARSLWLLGLPEQAMSTVRTSVELAGSLDSHVILSYVLAFAACPLALWTGDLAAAERYLVLLEQLCTESDSTFWKSWARLHRLAVDKRTESAPAGGLDPAEVWRRDLETLNLDLLGTLGDGLVAPSVLQRADAGLAPWCAPEILRSHGEQLLRTRRRAAAANAERLFSRALDEARRQHALAWELRAATSLARLWCEQGKRPQGRRLLDAVLRRFSEGSTTHDLVEARGLSLSLRN